MPEACYYSSFIAALTNAAPMIPIAAVLLIGFAMLARRRSG